MVPCTYTVRFLNSEITATTNAKKFGLLGDHNMDNITYLERFAMKMQG